MKHGLACVLVGALMGTAQAEDAPPATTHEVTPEVAPVIAPVIAPKITPGGTPAKPPALEVKPKHRGYATDQPEIFIRQRLFGRTHGLSLLTAACLELPAYSREVQDAYMAWYAEQANAIETIVRDLASYYFGPRANEAQWFDLVHALNLPDSIEPAMREVTLHAACASLPEAIPRSRYALDKLLAGLGDADALPDDIAVASGRQREGPATQKMPAPAPLLQKPAE